MTEAADKRTLRTFLRSGSRQVVAAFAGLLTYPIVARVLDDKQLGAWSLIAAASFVIGLADLGLSTAVQRAAVTEDQGLARRLMRLSLLTNCLLLPAFAGIGYIWLVHFTLRHEPAALQAEAVPAAAVALVGGILAGFVAPYRAFAFARGKARSVANARMIAALIYVSLLAIGFIVHPSLMAAAFALFVSSGIELILIARAGRMIDPALPLFPGLPKDRVEVRRAFRDGAAALAIHATGVIALRIDLFVLEAFRPIEVAGHYFLAGRAVDQAYLIVKQAITTLMPSLGDPNERARTLRIGTIAFAGVVISGMAALAFDGQQLLVLWLGDKASGEVPEITLMLLSLASMVLGMTEITGSMVMLGSRTAWACAIPVVVGSTINFAISLGGVTYCGVWAVAGGTGIGFLAMSVLMWRTAARMVGWRTRDVFKVLAVPLLVAVVTVSTSLAFRDFARRGPLQSIASCIVVFVLGAGITAAYFWWNERRA